jgi:hypothetical protein
MSRTRPDDLRGKWLSANLMTVEVIAVTAGPRKASWQVEECIFAYSRKTHPKCIANHVDMFPESMREKKQGSAEGYRVGDIIEEVRCLPSHRDCQ